MRPTTPAWRITLAFATVYLVWGSTYLAIRYAIGSIPPFLMAGTRLLTAGGVLYAWARSRGAPTPSRQEWRAAAISGGLMLVCGNGAVVWSETVIPSGLTALLVALVPAWTVIVEWVLPGGRAPARATALGLVAGLVGMVLLAGPGSVTGGASPWAVGALACGSLAWSIGTIYQHRGAPRPASSSMATSIQMLAGGTGLFLLFLILPGASRFRLEAVTGRSLLALGYLIVFGSLITFSAFVWLIQVSTPAKVSTYAYINPVVALLLGWAAAGESLDLRSLWASGLIVTAVGIITWDRSRRVA